MCPQQTVPASGSSGESAGRTLGVYRLVEELGRGGMGTVYKAYDPALDRYVAIKVLLEQFARDPQFLARFRQEAKAIARLNHPNILPIFYFGEEGGLIYIVMRYVEGGTLKDLIGRPLAVDQAVRLVMGIARALGHAHQQGVVHRDVKPANVLLAERDWPLLSDFGLARLMGDAVHLTQSGLAVGTPTYMSPEQGQGLAVDGRSDLYSLGIMLYELLTGETPFQAKSPLVVIFKHINTPLPMPRQANPDIPEALEQVLLRATAKDSVERYQAAEEMVEALERAMATFRASIRVLPPPKPGPLSLVADFVGREAELAAYARQLADTHLAVITGMAGVGKTALATELARRTDRPPQHIFWHTLHEDEGVVAVVWTLASFLAWHGRDGLWQMLQTARQTNVEPPPPLVLLDYLFQLLRGQDFLLCLDDLHFADDDPLFGQFMERLSQILGEGGLSLIVTSRHALSLGLATGVGPLAGLSMADAEHLLARHDLGLPAELTRELYTRTEGNAQLLRLVANLLKRTGDPARIKNALGLFHLKQGDTAAALTYLSDSIQLARDHHLKRELAFVLSSLATLHAHLEVWAAAEAALGEAEQAALETDTTSQLPEIHYTWARVRLGQGQVPAARDYAERALALAREEGIGLRVWGQVLLASGQRELALDAFRQSLSLLEGRDAYEAARTRALIGDLGLPLSGREEAKE